MGNYLNPGSQAFQMILESEIFVDNGIKMQKELSDR